MRLALRFSRAGAIAAGTFLLLAASVFAWLLASSATNPADSGEGGVLLLPFAAPWIILLPTVWVGPRSAGLAILTNAALLYFVCGGLRLRRR